MANAHLNIFFPKKKSKQKTNKKQQKPHKNKKEAPRGVCAPCLHENNALISLSPCK